jgi:hypothetical protein
MACQRIFVTPALTGAMLTENRSPPVFSDPTANIALRPNIQVPPPTHQVQKDLPPIAKCALKLSFINTDS